MTKITEYSDAEMQLRRWLEDRYPKAKKVDIKRVWKEGDNWSIEGELTIRTGIVGIKKQNFILRMNSDGEITGYEIFPIFPKKQ